MPNCLLVNESIFKRVLREKQHKSYPKTIIYLQSILNFRTFPLEIVFIESVMVHECQMCMTLGSSPSTQKYKIKLKETLKTSRLKIFIVYLILSFNWTQLNQFLFSVNSIRFNLIYKHMYILCVLVSSS